MLLNNENVDYLSEWPAHYYEIEDINERERILGSLQSSRS